MMRRIVSAALATFGIIAMIIGIGFLTFWAPDGNVKATAKAPSSAFIKTDPGVIDLIGEDVTITVEAPDDSEVIVAFGASDDIDAWAEGTDVATVTGLSDWHTLKVEGASTSGEAASSPTTTASATPTASATADDADAAEDDADAAEDDADATEFEDVDPELLASSDMWLQVEQQEKKVDLSYRVADAGAISLLATTTSGEAPTLTLSWNREVANNLAVPLIAVGALVTLIGILLFALDIQEGRRRRARRAAREAKFAKRAARAAASTSVMSAVEVEDLIAENDSLPDESRDVQSEKTGRAFGAGILPVSERAEELRNRELADEDRLVIPVAEGEPSAEDQGGAEDEAAEASGEAAEAAGEVTEAAGELSDGVDEDTDEPSEESPDDSEGDEPTDADAPVDDGEPTESAEPAEEGKPAESEEPTDETGTDSEENKNA